MVSLWRIHFDIWQNQYNIVKLKNKIKLKKLQSRNRKKKDMVSEKELDETEISILPLKRKCSR